jgi:P27 family predicted phage terminase small subunit
MGDRGPVKEPVAVKIAKGTDRAADRRTVAFVAPAGIPEKPAWISAIGGVASETWDERIAELSKVPNLLSPLDGPSIAHYCLMAQRVADAQRAIDAGGLISVGEKGAEYQHPAVGIQNKAIDTMERIGAHFGMNPSKRSAMRFDKPSTEGVRRRQPG